MPWNLLLRLLNAIRWIAYIIFLLGFFVLIKYVISHILIMRNTVLWFLGESGMIGFMTIQAIWLFIFFLLFALFYKVLKSF